MADLTSIERMKLEKIFGMGSGYVLNFSNRTFQDFFIENIGVDIYNPAYDFVGSSKANRLRAFWKKENNIIAGKSIFCLLDYWKALKSLDNQIINFAEQSLFDECLTISHRLCPLIDVIESNGNNKEKKKDTKSEKLKFWLSKFDDMAISKNPHQRGFLLQDLFNELFLIHEIPVANSFQRNSGGEQIDGAFIFLNWYYLVECKWTKKLADIRELDSLLGKVNRSGKQTMGIFLSIEGWSENVPSLLKQNPEKSIILMDGYDLRCVLSEGIELEKLLSEKIIKLNLKAEPFYSASNMMRGK